MYIYNAKKLKRSVHILNDKTSASYCKIENSIAGRKITTQSLEVPDGRKVCSVCLTLSAGAKPQKDFYTSWEWAKLRFEVLKAYGAICMCCRATENLVVDHIKPRSRFPELEWNFDNLQVLCDQCNRGKSNDDYTDFRPKCPAPELTGDEWAHMKSIQ